MAKKVQHPNQALVESPKTAESRFLKFSWIVIAVLAIVLGAFGLSYVTCGKAKQERQLREPPVGSERQR
jgi:hypothetical protein